MGYARCARPIIVCGCLAGLAWGSSAEILRDPGTHPHRQILQNADGFRLESEGVDAPIPDITAYCVGCHPDNEGGIGGATDADAVHTNHPVDVHYPEGKPQYVPFADLDSKLRLVEGNLSCITCHDPRAADRALVIGLEDGKLCLACHRI